MLIVHVDFPFGYACIQSDSKFTRYQLIPFRSYQVDSDHGRQYVMFVEGHGPVPRAGSDGSDQFS